MSAGSYPRRRTLAFGGSALLCELADPAAERCAAFLFGAALAPGELPGSTHARYWLAADAAGWRVSRRDAPRYAPDVPLYAGPDPVIAADLFMADATNQLALRSAGGLLFHAGLLAGPAGAALVPGAIGAGKSTLTAWLLQQGWGYLSDELAYVPEASNVALGLPRPLNLKAPWRDVLGVQPAPGAGLLAGSGFDLVAARLLAPPDAPPPPAAPLPLRVALFPQRAAGAELAITPLSPAQAGLALMRCLINARNLPDHGFAQVAGLARGLRAWLLRYDHVQQLIPWLDSLWGAVCA